MSQTKRGDDGKTNLYGCDQRISKSSAITEALGCLDEINSYLGVVKTNLKNEVLGKEKISKNSGQVQDLRSQGGSHR